MTTTPIRSQVGLAFKARLEKVTEDNGYDHTIKAVYYDKIPMGLELLDHQLPALFLLDEGANHTHEHQTMDIAVSYRIQLVHGQVTDQVLQEIQRAIARVIFADSPVIDRTDQYRIHTRVYQIEMVDDETDLHMIEANRIATMRFIVHYRTKPYDL